jgi:hypothetical protein
MDLSPVTLRSGSDHFVDCALNILRALEINVNDLYLNRDTWQASVLLDYCDRMLGLRLVTPSCAFGHPAVSPFMTLMALFV